jgi:hypothetical protein
MEFTEKEQPAKAPSAGEDKNAVYVRTGSATTTIDTVAAKKLTRKLDLWLIPIIMLLYLFAFLDRGACSQPINPRFEPALTGIVNIGNAKLYGLEEDLGLKGNQYQVCVSILFVTYCVS